MEHFFQTYLKEVEGGHRRLQPSKADYVAQRKQRQKKYGRELLFYHPTTVVLKSQDGSMNWGSNRYEKILQKIKYESLRVTCWRSRHVKFTSTNTVLISEVQIRAFKAKNWEVADHDGNRARQRRRERTLVALPSGSEGIWPRRPSPSAIWRSLSSDLLALSYLQAVQEIIINSHYKISYEQRPREQARFSRKRARAYKLSLCYLFVAYEKAFDLAKMNVALPAIVKKGTWWELYRSS